MNRVCFVIPTLLALAAAPAGPARADDLILDESAYWRYHLTMAPAQISPAKLKSEGLKTLGKRQFDRLKRRGRDTLIRMKRKPDEDWTGLITYDYSWRGNSGSADVTRTVRTACPPGRWTRPDFDDSDWARRRLPFLVRRYYGSRVWYNQDLNLGVQIASYRTTFDVPDPTAVGGGLTLEVRYRGGVRVFVNGAEVARGHLASGTLTDEARGEDYPAEAYYLKPDETKPVRGVDPVPMSEQRYDFDQLPKVKGSNFRRCGALYVSRAGYDRIAAARTRRLAGIKIPAKLLRKGTNVLAVEVRASNLHPLAMTWGAIWGANLSWFHAMLEGLELRGQGAPSMLRRPAGVQVWVEDIHHRVYSRDFATPLARASVARIIAARNGTFAAQIVVGGDRRMRGLAAAVSELKGLAGQKPLPASAIKVRWAIGHPASDLSKLGENRGKWTHDPFSDNWTTVMARYGPPEAQKNRERAAEALGKLMFFDELQASPPPVVKADSAQPIWVSVTVPASAAAGRYAGAVTIRAEGIKPIQVPLELAVIDWPIPVPADFQTVMALEQSPYAVARHYKVPLWSDEHFRLMEGSFRLLGKVDNDWLNIPVVCYSEFGNREDSPLRWKRTGDGGFELDLARLGRYLDLAIRHCGPPMVVNFVINHPSMPGRDAIPPLYISVEAASGKTALLEVTKLPAAQQRLLWRTLATKLYAFMKARGLAKSMYWGYGWDGLSNPGLVDLMRQFVPEVRWAKGCHGAGPDETFTAVSSIYNRGIVLGADSRRGWKVPAIHLYNPRHAGTAMTCFGNAPPFGFRVLMDRAIVAGGRGVARLGADYWGPVYMDGYKTGIYYIGLPGNFLFWPGPAGANTATRFEIMREGLQETEARIFLEQAMEASMPDALKRRVGQELKRHNCQTLVIPPGSSAERLVEYSTGWQKRSARLYQVAAEVARLVGVDAATTRLAVQVPARGAKTVPLRIRNWSGRPRRWTLAADRPWIKIEPAGGTLAPGQEDVTVTLDATGLQPGKQATGVLTLTDAASGQARKIQVAATVGEVFSATCKGNALNVAPGGSDRKMLRLFNHSRQPLVWRASSSADWATIAPAGGTLPAGKGCDLVVTARPPGDRLARHDTTVTFTEHGRQRRDVPLTAYVLTPYRVPAAAPSGEAVRFNKLPKGTVFTARGKRLDRWIYYERPEAARRIKVMLANSPTEYKLAVRGYVANQTVCTIEGKGFKAFSAEVGPPPSWTRRNIIPLIKNVRLHFEVYVDGRLVAHSGPMCYTDKPRRLVVTGLEKVKELRLVVRLGNGDTSGRTYGLWVHPALHR